MASASRLTKEEEDAIRRELPIPPGASRSRCGDRRHGGIRPDRHDSHPAHEKKKLVLKDRIGVLEDQLLPDIIA